MRYVVLILHPIYLLNGSELCDLEVTILVNLNIIIETWIYSIVGEIFSTLPPASMW